MSPRFYNVTINGRTMRVVASSQCAAEKIARERMHKRELRKV